MERGPLARVGVPKTIALRAVMRRQRGGESMTNALFNDNRLKLGVFGLNGSNGCAATTAEGHLQPTWHNNAAIAAMAGPPLAGTG